MEILLYLLMSFTFSNSAPDSQPVGESVGDLSFNTTLSNESSVVNVSSTNIDGSLGLIR